MWNIFRTKTPFREGLFRGFTDRHTHLLAGVDDGISTLEESLTALSVYEQLGAKCVWCTPHIMEEQPTETASLRAKFDELKAAYRGSIDLQLAAEYMIDGGLAERLHTNDLLTFDDKRLLVETSYLAAPTNFLDTLAQVNSLGFTPILAHPERYDYLDFDGLAELKKNFNLEFQLNIGSLLGHYGNRAKLKATKLLRSGLYDFAATDLHSAQTFNHLANKSITTDIYRQLAQIIHR